MLTKRTAPSTSLSLSHALIERSEAKVEMANEKMMNGRYIASVVAVLPKYYVVIIKGLKVRGSFLWKTTTA